jgi:hypothetical protein
VRGAPQNIPRTLTLPVPDWHSSPVLQQLANDTALPLASATKVDRFALPLTPTEPSPTLNLMRLPPRRGAMLLVVTMLLACDSTPSDPAPPKPPPSIATSNPDASATTAPRSASTPSATPPAPRATVASLRKAASENPGAFEGESVTRNAFFVQLAQKQFGTGEHPRHHFAQVDVALEPFVPDGSNAPDTLACYYPEWSWPPKGLNPGDPIVVTGRWSFAQLLAGGWRPGGGPLSIAGCRVERASTNQ